MSKWNVFLLKLKKRLTKVRKYNCQFSSHSTGYIVVKMLTQNKKRPNGAMNTSWKKQQRWTTVGSAGPRTPL